MIIMLTWNQLEMTIITPNGVRNVLQLQQLLQQLLQRLLQQLLLQQLLQLQLQQQLQLQLLPGLSVMMVGMDFGTSAISINQRRKQGMQLKHFAEKNLGLPSFQFSRKMRTGIFRIWQGVPHSGQEDSGPLADPGRGPICGDGLTTRRSSTLIGIVVNQTIMAMEMNSTYM